MPSASAPPPVRDPRRVVTFVLSAIVVVLGVAILVRTFAAGGGALALGVIVGVLFTLAGAGRLWMAWRGF